MRFTEYPQHVALISDQGIIHAYIQARRVVEHRLDQTWQDRIETTFKFPGVD